MLKLQKRIVFGRANFDVLRLSVLCRLKKPASSSCSSLVFDLTGRFFGKV